MEMIRWRCGVVIRPPNRAIVVEPCGRGRSFLQSPTNSSDSGGVAKAPDIEWTVQSAEETKVQGVEPSSQFLLNV